MLLREVFKGCETHRGILAKIDEEGHKTAYLEKKGIDWDKHEANEVIQGISPVDTNTWQCRWICLDIDLRIKRVKMKNTKKDISKN